VFALRKRPCVARSARICRQVARASSMVCEDGRSASSASCHRNRRPIGIEDETKKPRNVCVWQAATGLARQRLRQSWHAHAVLPAVRLVNPSVAPPAAPSPPAMLLRGRRGAVARVGDNGEVCQGAWGGGGGGVGCGACVGGREQSILCPRHAACVTFPRYAR